MYKRVSAWPDSYSLFLRMDEVIKLIFFYFCIMKVREILIFFYFV